MVQEIHKAVMNDLCEILKFDEETWSSWEQTTGKHIDLQNGSCSS
jgi:hypothetical protein